MLRPSSGLDPAVRVRAMNLLSASVDDISLVRDIEAGAFSAATSTRCYMDIVKRCARNIVNNPSNACAEIALLPDDALLEGTLLQRIRDTEKQRRESFQRMLAEKSALMETRVAYKSSLTCRRCGSNDVSYEVKQTRSSDEACTAFLVCITCQNRWTIH
jgi:DNA-directed RNA polymerase subunit M/transcription elongation factor TFIIS